MKGCPVGERLSNGPTRRKQKHQSVRGNMTPWGDTWNKGKKSRCAVKARIWISCSNHPNRSLSSIVLPRCIHICLKWQISDTRAVISEVELFVTFSSHFRITLRHLYWISNLSAQCVLRRRGFRDLVTQMWNQTNGLSEVSIRFKTWGPVVKNSWTSWFIPSPSWMLMLGDLLFAPFQWFWRCIIHPCWR